jgi:hypothetical protein
MGIAPSADRESIALPVATLVLVSSSTAGSAV